MDYPHEETGQTIISGMGELHLDIIRDRLFREFKVEANAGKPQIAYRETILSNAEGEGKFIDSLVVADSMGMPLLELNLRKKEKVLKSSTRLSAVPFLRIYKAHFPGYKRSCTWWCSCWFPGYRL